MRGSLPKKVEGRGGKLRGIGFHNFLRSEEKEAPAGATGKKKKLIP